ncbi:MULTISPECIES: tyrosine-type recombinase/integrase [Methylosinus]|uniref:Integrase n=1 Tax=Methylosinus trichosporium (strain ATCC 35070 / NCIMB 11131 / UNIQEM 75 / OB3b) TaxID=595536 RepID=A0A2D2CVZ9_METT3|nr:MULTISPECIES: site-specific integrase [Methylosinus]ATQ66883.1 integrase [Methylosinus trichosporium OB3b]OBS54153.1 integrase [Methylosinus sp. 3S-1]
MAKTLTTAAIKQLKPGAVRREIPDGDRGVNGLYFVIQPSGARSWAFRYRFQGQARKLTFDGCKAKKAEDAAEQLTLARELAKQAMATISRGEDPATKKQEAKRQAAAARPAHDLIENVCVSYIDRQAKPNTREASWREVERILNKEIVPAWRGRRLGDITRGDIHELLDKIKDRPAPILANRTLAAFRRVCNWAIGRGIIEASPCDRVKAPVAETSRDRVLSDNELRLTWGAFDGAGWPFGPIGKLLLLTGARRDEVAHMTWSEVDLAGKLWTIPKERAKNGAAHEVPLSATAVAILKGLPKIEGGKDAPGYIFTTTGKTPVSGFSKAKDQFDAAILEAMQAAAADPETVKAPERWTLHDLRRTCASGMAGLGIAPHVVEAVLNHRSGTIKGVAAVYNRYSYSAEKRAALDAWARRLDAIVTGRAAANVVELKKKGRR